MRKFLIATAMIIALPAFAAEVTKGSTPAGGGIVS